MYNYFMLLGNVVEEPILEELEEGKEKAVIKLKVNRSFPNAYGKYEADVFSITVWSFLAHQAQENLTKGVPLMVKGRIQTSENGIELIGERFIYFNNQQEGDK